MVEAFLSGREGGQRRIFSFCHLLSEMNRYIIENTVIMFTAVVEPSLVKHNGILKMRGW